MTDGVKIALSPLGTTIEAMRDTALLDLLHPYGVEFPCGGKGRCRGCMVEVVEGDLPPTEDERRIREPGQIEAGWRLACRCRASANATLRVDQWDSVVLAEHSRVQLEPRDGCGVGHLRVGRQTGHVVREFHETNRLSVFVAGRRGEVHVHQVAFAPSLDGRVPGVRADRIAGARL